MLGQKDLFVVRAFDYKKYVLLYKSIMQNPNLLDNYFAHNENIFSTCAGVIEIIRTSKGLEQYETLSNAGKILMCVGWGLSVGLSAYNNYHDNS